MKPPFPFVGYIENEEASRNSMSADAWFLTGDLGYMDDESFLFFVGRNKEMIKYRGFQISPSELEEFLVKETGFTQLCVVGIEVPSQGADLAAAAILKSDNINLSTADVQKIADEKLPDYKKFRGGVHFVESLPTTPSGKVKRIQVREMIEKIYWSKNSGI